MNVKKAIHFTHAEKNILTQLVQKFEILKSKSMHGDVISKKNEAWHKIACLFNAHQETRVKRLPRQLRKLWENMKQRKQTELKLKKQLEESLQANRGEVKVEEIPSVEFFDIGDGFREQESILISHVDEATERQSEFYGVRLSILKEQLLKAKAETEKAECEARRAAAEEELAVLKLKKFKETQIEI